MEHKLPDLSKMSSRTLELEPIFIDGQKLLFDEKITLMPITLETSDL